MAAPAPSFDPGELLRLAIEKGSDAEQLTKWVDLAERMEKMDSKRRFAAAMAHFQGACPIIQRKSETDRYTYASFDEIIRQVRSLLSECGFSVGFQNSFDDASMTVTCVVSHSAGHSESYSIKIPLDQALRANESQRAGSANSYGRRYSFMNAFNIVVSNEDDDAFLLTQGTLSQGQIAEIERRIEEIVESGGKFDRAGFLKFLGVTTLESLPSSKFGFALKSLAAKIMKMPEFTPPAAGKGGKKAAPKPAPEPKQEEKPAEAPAPAPEAAPHPPAEPAQRKRRTKQEPPQAPAPAPEPPKAPEPATEAQSAPAEEPSFVLDAIQEMSGGYWKVFLTPSDGSGASTCYRILSEKVAGECEALEGKMVYIGTEKTDSGMTIMTSVQPA